MMNGWKCRSIIKGIAAYDSVTVSSHEKVGQCDTKMRGVESPIETCKKSTGIVRSEA